ncbi:hypothetical protein ACLB1E_23505 [Escherichia coli]
MTTLIPFKPDGRGPFQFTARIGEYETFARVPFNLYANRYYLELKDSSGDVIVYTPLIASPDNYDIMFWRCLARRETRFVKPSTSLRFRNALLPTGNHQS